ncbi:hypothetical protein [Lacticaseibacillus paracasei]|uniref:hypothetical protein n=1 Tax=Lacticaseibacillus paracasei TaxID=1597 RepID=UPI00194E3234|nr:hypothetical protein [Lacticaseibacillus paracasei]
MNGATCRLTRSNNTRRQFSMCNFLLLLTLIFVMAKLFGLIAWSWLLVFAPLIVMIAVVTLLIVLAIVIGLHEE